jgi:hypothetical protein
MVNSRILSYKDVVITPANMICTIDFLNRIKEGIQSFLSYIGQDDIKNANQCIYNIICK